MLPELSHDRVEGGAEVLDLGGPAELVAQREVLHLGDFLAQVLRRVEPLAHLREGRVVHLGEGLHAVVLGELLGVERLGVAELAQLDEPRLGVLHAGVQRRLERCRVHRRRQRRQRPEHAGVGGLVRLLEHAVGGAVEGVEDVLDHHARIGVRGVLHHRHEGLAPLADVRQPADARRGPEILRDEHPEALGDQLELVEALLHGDALVPASRPGLAPALLERLPGVVEAPALRRLELAQALELLRGDGLQPRAQLLQRVGGAVDDGLDVAKVLGVEVVGVPRAGELLDDLHGEWGVEGESARVARLVELVELREVVRIHAAEGAGEVAHLLQLGPAHLVGVGEVLQRGEVLHPHQHLGELGPAEVDGGGAEAALRGGDQR